MSVCLSVPLTQSFQALNFHHLSSDLQAFLSELSQLSLKLFLNQASSDILRLVEKINIFLLQVAMLSLQ